MQRAQTASALTLAISERLRSTVRRRCKKPVTLVRRLLETNLKINIIPLKESTRPRRSLATLAASPLTKTVTYLTGERRAFAKTTPKSTLLWPVTAYFSPVQGRVACNIT